jgi:bifunctional ADP-heptose synthase (sugar kinase/adenylyltransferase)
MVRRTIYLWAQYPSGTIAFISGQPAAGGLVVGKFGTATVSYEELFG